MSRTLRLVLGSAGVVAALVVGIEVFVHDPTIAAVLAAVTLAFLDWWRRRRRLQVRKEDH